MVKTVVIIPALNPLNSIIDYVNTLKEINIDKIIIINDGSDEKYEPVFKELQNIEWCTVLNHGENLGKGRALKTGFSYVLNHHKNVDSIITAGAHGQHQIEDVAQIIRHAELFSDGIILGVRNFNTKDMPLISTIGNRAASVLFELFFHRRLLDTQTSLRCIPKQVLPWLIRVNGEDFSFDTNMLVEAIKRKIPIYEIPIGQARIKKNSIMFYDEITNAHKLIQQMITTYTKSKKQHE
ncbi:glycosyltransferase involved in cell wall bisynthesis [Ureibacillus xyleni]|uniref:Glycosyltransferase involved in cell wall bisynthesis n=1 Tax=Ureibacillus xyleni TaxID=614648 RepID=A0A285TM18_9BACL|nr:glycosyltransferase family 2 protein [Ureibacillus xyleni]SOC23103.1 glycosyltransferase involved in cell wall bisynthesis [Ureibacillus xyleni]